MIHQTEIDIRDVCNEIAQMLVEKNRAYGDSALEPQRIFSHSDPIEQIKVRIDDKLSRLHSAKGMTDAQGEDVEKDLLGYLILLRIARKRQARKAECDKLQVADAQYQPMTTSAQEDEFHQKAESAIASGLG